jgi:hypothetical protein
MDLFGCIVDEGCPNLPTIDQEGDIIIFDTPAIKWDFSPSDVCYFQAYKLDGCMRKSFSDVCVECSLSGQSNAMSPSCTEMDNFTIGECVDSNCYGGGSLCLDFAMDLFECVVNEDCPNLPTFH